MNSLHMTSKVLFTSELLPAHITVHESSFMNSPFMIPKAPLDIILLSAHSTLGESCFMYSPYMKYKAPLLLQSFLHTSHLSLMNSSTQSLRHSLFL